MEKRLLIFIALISLPLSYAATIEADSCSQADVQAAVNQAQDGDTVLIPDGTCTYASGISTSKQIRIEAKNYVPTKGGDTVRSVVITNNADESLFSLVTGNDYHVGLSGIRFNEGTGTGAHLSVGGSGSKVALINDLFFEVKDRYWPVDQVVDWSAQGGVLWNIHFEGIAAAAADGVGPQGGSFYIGHQPRPWYTASTMGSFDTNGDVNLYLEDSSCSNVGQFPDVDENGRAVFRHNTLDGCTGGTHGYTSAWGGRFIEYYNNVFSVTSSMRNIAGRYVWLRGGTVLFTDNTVNNAANPSAYGSPVLLSIGDTTAPGTYPMSRQPGWGHDGSIDVSDPIYIWGNTGTRAGAYGFANGWDSIVKLNRDIYVNSGPKPGYSKYTYPHPAREEEHEEPQVPPCTQLPEGDNGIAAMYPGDAGIGDDPDVIMADDFESYNAVSELYNKWDNFHHEQYISFDIVDAFAGAQSLEFTIPQTSTEIANALIKDLNPTQDIVFIRAYTKFSPGFSVIGSGHNGLGLQSSYWDGPGSGPGIPADGYNKFYVNVENSREDSSEASPGLTHIYIYHPEQRDIWGDHFYPEGRVVPYDVTPGDFGDCFVPRPNFTPQMDRWYSYELMVKANTPGERDGRIAFWIDGNLVADFTGMRLRDTAELKIDKADISLHANTVTDRENKKWYDNVVVARSYIGPMYAEPHCITISQLSGRIADWKGGMISINQLMEAIKDWKGC